MTSVRLKMAFSTVIVLNSALDTIMTEHVKYEDGTEKDIPRKLPFDARFAFTRNKNTLKTSMDIIDSKKDAIIEEMKVKGSYDHDFFKQSIYKVLSEEVDQLVYQIKPHEFDAIEGFDELSPEVVNLFKEYLVGEEDPDYKVPVKEEEIENIKINEEPSFESSSETKVEKPKKTRSKVVRKASIKKAKTN